MFDDELRKLFSKCDNVHRMLLKNLPIEKRFQLKHIIGRLLIKRIRVPIRKEEWLLLDHISKQEKVNSNVIKLDFNRSHLKQMRSVARLESKALVLLDTSFGEFLFSVRSKLENFDDATHFKAHVDILKAIACWHKN